jgi:hypothetical protein
MDKPFILHTSGSLQLKDTNAITLKILEEFCAEARRLGLPDNQRLHTSRQGMLGPISAWHFDIPVIPKEVNQQCGDSVGGSTR